MIIKIITGQRKSDLIDYYNNNFKSYKGDILIFPETKTYHAYDLADYIMEIVHENINKNKDLIIITYSEIVLDAARLQMARHSFKGGQCISVMDDNSVIEVDINENGEMNEWPSGVFDIKLIILRELFEIGKERRKKDEI